jgi:hypothetical protein
MKQVTNRSEKKMPDDRLEQAIINVLETQSTMQNQMVLFQNQMSKLAEKQVNSDKRWIELKQEVDEVKEILKYHTTLLLNLPDAIKEKIGFKA